MTWTRIPDAGEWALLVAGRGEVARIRKVGARYLLVTLLGRTQWFDGLAKAKRGGTRTWNSAESYYAAGLHVMRFQKST